MKTLILFVLGFYSVSALGYFHPQVNPYSFGAYNTYRGPQAYCPHPAQLSSLYKKSRRPSLSSKVRALKKSIKIMDRIVRKLRTKLSNLSSELEEFLNEQKLGETPADVAQKIEDYMMLKLNKWCDDEPVVYFYPRSVQELFSYLIPQAVGGTDNDKNNKGSEGPAGCGEGYHHNEEGECVLGALARDLAEIKSNLKGTPPDDGSRDKLAGDLPKNISNSEGQPPDDGSRDALTEEQNTEELSITSNDGEVVVINVDVDKGKTATPTVEVEIVEIKSDGETAEVPVPEVPVSEVSVNVALKKPARLAAEVPVPEVPVSEVSVNVALKKPARLAAEVPVPEVPVSEVDGSSAQKVCEIKPWQGKKYFGSRGKVKRNFCKKYSKSGTKNKRNCQKTIEDMEDLNDKIVELREEQAELEDNKEDLEDQIDDNELDKILGRDSDDDETEAGSTYCPECEYHREARKLTTGQKVGNTLSIIAGLGLSYYGVREARKAQSSANDLLALQGFPAENNFGYSLAGASLGVPFINHGILGLSRGNMVAGSYACSHPYAIRY